ncbi:heavy metal translocating P-type ATPase [Clostridium fallax]|uniref:Cd2+/Zn2+-exporting ATPase n=1 Tax=Clostridium fallax TaxID=1533 RepID=A0A1M4YEZ3_9CLOT|nr:heavy metal translocating P-type ATPase [Clostridium fallax]SHF04173.1 Cd2+/Zn2+-exporting ATPase [Clostridium fallax]SQB22314.1 cadmium-translocating P-type ATPase [Clostridium fallax]
MSKIFLNLEGLDCAGCAAKIEDRVNRLENVKEATLNFATKSLIIEGYKDENNDDIIIKTKDIIKKLEPDVIVSEKKHGNNKIKRPSVISKSSDRKIIIKNKEKKQSKVSFMENLETKEIIKFSIGFILFIIGLTIKVDMSKKFIIFLISYILVGGEIVYKAFKNILKGEVFDENFLMSVATIGAFAIKEFPEAVAVMIFYQVGEMFQSLAVNRSRKSIEELMDIRPDYANLIVGNKETKVAPERVNIGEYIIVKPGEKVPLDGTIIEGEGFLDTSALTGESILREVKENDEILAGCINKNGLLKIKVTKDFGESTVSKILELVQNAGSKKAKTEKFITKFAKYYTPIVVLGAVALAFIPPLLLGIGTISEWVNRALVFLVVSCPCALVISIPLGFFGGIGAASKKGILIKGGNYLETLKNINTVVFDKTGTLTKGVFKVLKVQNIGDVSKEDILKYAAYAESYSNHPIAKSITEKYDKKINKNLIKNYKEIAGFGIQVEVNGKNILAGNKKLMDMFNIRCNDSNEMGTLVHIAINKVYYGYILIGDEIKKDSAITIDYLKKLGVKKVIMLTGDNKKVSSKVKDYLKLDEAYAELLPNDKVEKLEEIFLENSNGKVMFVGDGINDAPVLARADIGVAMGGVGSDAAIEAADVVIMNDELAKIPLSIRIARKTNRIVWENIIFALSVKVIILILGAMGFATMWEAVFGDVGVALIAVLNSMRALKLK